VESVTRLAYALSAALLLSHLAEAQQSSSTINIVVSNQVDTTSGINGRLQMAMSTSFQLMGSGDQFFNSVPQATLPLNALAPSHTRVQVISDGIPLTAPGTWDFTELNTMLPVIQSTGDHSPELQIAAAPAFLSDSNGQIPPSSFGDFAAMSANLVQYYNTGGFDVGGQHFQSPSAYPVTWWGIFNEPNGNGLDPQQYVALYNAAASAMKQADPSIKLVALELSDYGQQAEAYMPAFVAGVTAPVDVLATHFYSSCNQQIPDESLFPTVLDFASEVNYIRSQLAGSAALAQVPVWVTENNVNSDFATSNGTSFCNGTPYVVDPRGTSAFFAAWRSLVFELLGQAGSQALYHWSFTGDTQYGEIDGSANPYLSYWVDYYLSHWLPSPPGQDILQVTETGCCLWIGSVGAMLGLDTHTLAARNPDGSVVILMSNHAVQKPTDNNGPGVSRTFALDLSALGTFTSATLVTLDSATPSSGPQLQPLTPSAQMQVTLPGYGAALLRLSNEAPVLPAAGVVNAASFLSGPVAPGEIISLFGSALGPAAPVPAALTNPKLVADSLVGVRVTFDGVPAPLLYASSGQVNAVVPYSVAGETSTQLQVEYLGAFSAPVTLPVAATAPGIFSQAGSGKGPGAILNSRDESVNSASNPAARGDWVSIYATGAGVTNPTGVDGLLASAPLAQPIANVSVTIGGVPCELNYAGAAPGFVSGLLQINAMVPAEVTPGPNVPVEVTIGNAPSQSTITLAVQ
jgi:uncharacterized protein (TIGR03437 family)